MKKYILFFFLSSFEFISFAMPSDTIKNELHIWKLIEGFLEESTDFDTTINYFQRYNPLEKHSISYSYLGNLGSPWKSNIYFSEFQAPNFDFSYDKLYWPYVLSKNNILFYQAKKPYFELEWESSNKQRNENQVSALYTQNINKKWNVGIRYKLISSNGEISNSKTGEHSLNFFTSYHSEKYSMHAAFLRNKFKNNESGGINDSLITTMDLAEPLLKGSSSVYYKRDFFISQQYKFGITDKIVINDSTTETNFKEWGRLNYIFSTSKNYRSFNESSDDFSYYRNTYYATAETLDSNYFSKFENILYWSFKEIIKENFKGRLTIGGAHEYITTSMIDGTYAFYKIDNYSDFKLSANLDARTKNFIFSVNGFFYPKISSTNTYKSGSFSGNLLIDKSMTIGKWHPDFYFKLNLSKITPSLVDLNYTSIHFRWNNISFNDKIYTEAKVGFKIPQSFFDLEFAYGLDRNEIYYDSLALPKQFNDLLLVKSFRLQKDFHLGGFVINNKIIYQTLNNKDEILSIPKWSIYHSSLYDLKRFLEKYSIEVQLGYEIYYTSKYYAPGYMPASGQFYQQRIRQTGEYPILNAFLNMRIKTVLIFIKFENVINQFSINKFYYLANNYPINSMAFKFGVSWRFMD